MLPAAVRDEALRLRELLKFEFLFSARAQFEKDLADEVRSGRWKTPANLLTPPSCGDCWNRPICCWRLVLRPFLDAYHIVADRLAAYEDESLTRTPS